MVAEIGPLLVVRGIPEVVARRIQPGGGPICIVIAGDLGAEMASGRALEIRIRGAAGNIEIIARTVE